MKNIEPSLPKGFRDYLPENQIVRQEMLDTIRATFERFGFVPLDTPCIERKEILTGGDDDFGMHIFTAGIDGNNEKLALRFDLTVPLARVVAEHQNEIQKPFKRYQIGKVWRGENPQAGRYREFVQCDADIIGSSNVTADAEIVSIMYVTLFDLGVKKFLIRVNNRKILNSLSEYVEFSKDKTAVVLRTLDKLDKYGWKVVEKELNDESGLSKIQINKIHEFIEISEKDKEKKLNLAEKLLGKFSEAKDGINELRRLILRLNAFGVPNNMWDIDFSVSRGLGYYTGIVFEAILTDLPKLGSVMSGGRYDNLVSRFGSRVVPATGVSLGIDRLFVGLEELKLISLKKSFSKVLVLNFDEESELVCIKALSDMRNCDISSELYLGNEKTMRGQLSYALKKEIPFVVIIGSDERERKVAQVKNLQKREQIEISLDKIGDEIKKMI